MRDALRSFLPRRLRDRIAWMAIGLLILTQAVALSAHVLSERRQEDRLTAHRLGRPMAEILRAAETALGEGRPVGAGLPAGPDGSMDVVWYPGPEPFVPPGWLSEPVPLPRMPGPVAGPSYALVSVEGAAFPVDRLPALPAGAGLEAALADLSAALAAGMRPARVALQLSDGSWLDFASPRHWRARATPVLLGLSVLMASAAALGAALWMAGRLARPLEELAVHANRPDDRLRPRPLPETGPEEVANIARAINRTRSALSDLLDERTRLLAAISHDLRTPATRLRLRAEFVEDDGLREKILADLDEMQGMIVSTLDFLAEDVMREAVEVVSFTSLLQSLCDDYADMGMPVSLEGPPPLEFETVRTVFGGPAARVAFQQDRPLRLRGRPRSLRRAFANLIENAVKYGGRAQISVHADAEEVVVEILDDGPGIPEAELPNVFKPFYRLEASRNRQTGGNGLGLSIVKSIVEAHQGRIDLMNRLRGGLRVRVTLPRLL